MEYVTVKIPRKGIPIIRELQAEETLEEGRRVTQGEVIIEALEEKKAKQLAGKRHAEKKSYTFWELYGSIKGKGKKRNFTNEIDEVVYGDVDRT